MPWREWLIQYQNKKLKQMLIVSGLFASAFVLIVHLFLANANANYADELHSLQKTSQHLSEERDDLPTDQSLLVAKNNAWINAKRMLNQVLSILVRVKTKTVCLSEFNFENNEIVLAGYTSSAKDLTVSLPQWIDAYSIEDIKIENLTGRSFLKFNLRLTIAH